MGLVSVVLLAAHLAGCSNAVSGTPIHGADSVDTSTAQSSSSAALSEDGSGISSNAVTTSNAPGKCVVVTTSRRIAVALYAEIVAFRPDWHSYDDDAGVVKVVITGSATDPAALQPHIRNKTERRALRARARDADDLLEMVIVRDMCLTGFDSTPMHTTYVDKPMRSAGLMQAITRVNRTFLDKSSGLIVDYIGLAYDLREAPATYTDRDKRRRAIGEDVRASVIPEMLAEHSAVSGVLAGIDWVATLSSGGAKTYAYAVTEAADYLLESEHGANTDDGSEAQTGESDTGPGAGEPSLNRRFMAHTTRLKKLYALVPTSPEAVEVRDEVAFFDGVRASIAKIEATDREGAGDGLDTASRQIISVHAAGGGVIDIFAEAGLAKPDTSVIDDEFLKHFEASDQKNLQLEAVRRLISKEVKVIAKRNIVAGRKLSEMLADALGRYQNRTVTSSQVIAEIVALPQATHVQRRRGKETGLTENELAFYDAMLTNASAREAMKDETIRAIAHDLTAIVRRDAKTDWQVKDSVRAKLRTLIKRLLLKHGHPPDQEPAATEIILQQAKLQVEEA
jgi:type I restriction enzyme R subunit